MKRKRDACNQADVDKRNFEEVCLPPPSSSIPGLEGFKYDAGEQISRVLATPPVTTSQHHGRFYDDGASILTLRQAKLA